MGMNMAQAASQNCEICDLARREEFCIDCEQSFCENCKALHLRSKVSTDHTFQKSSNGKFLVKSLCHDHGEDLIFLCLECDSTICSRCITGIHNGHKVSSIEEPISTLGNDIQSDIETKMKSLQTGLSEIEQNFDTINKVKFNLIDVVNEEGRKIKEMVDGHIINVVQSIYEQTDQQVKQQELFQVRIIEQVEKLTLLQHDTEEIQNAKRKGSLLERLKQIQTDIKSVEIPKTKCTNMEYIQKDIKYEDVAKLLGTTEER